MSTSRCFETYMVCGEIPCSIASAKTKGLNALPDCRWAWVARLNLTWSKSEPPTIALIARVGVHDGGYGGVGHLLEVGVEGRVDLEPSFVDHVVTVLLCQLPAHRVQ